MGVTLVNTRMSHKLGDPGDLVELAKTVQKVKERKDEFRDNTYGCVLKCDSYQDS